MRVLMIGLCAFTCNVLAAPLSVLWLGDGESDNALHLAFQQQLAAGQTEPVQWQRLNLTGLAEGQRDESLSMKLNNADLVVSDTPESAGLINHSGFQGRHLALRLLRAQNSCAKLAHCSGIYTDASTEQWLSLIQALPFAAHKIGIIFGPGAAIEYQNWSRRFSQSHLDFQPLMLHYGDRTTPFLAHYLPRIDVLLMPALSGSVDEADWAALALANMQGHVWLIGHRAEHLAAGAIAALYETDEARAQQGVRLAKALLDNKPEAVESPAPLLLNINHQVARTMNIAIEAHTISEHLAFAVQDLATEIQP